MMYSGQDGNSDDAPRPLDCSTQGRIFLERQVSACLVAVGGIRSEDTCMRRLCRLCDRQDSRTCAWRPSSGRAL